jgi:hypothetical protein
VLAHLPSKHEDLSSKVSMAKKEKQTTCLAPHSRTFLDEGPWKSIN